MNLKAIDTIIFDLDGTLVDTAPDLTSALNHVLASAGREAVALEEVRHMVGFGARAMIFKGLDHTGGRLPEVQIEFLHRRFLDYYKHNICAYSLPYPGAVAILEAFKATGKALGICTNKPTALAEQLLEELGLDDYFGAVVGGDAVTASKPDAHQSTNAIAIDDVDLLLAEEAHQPHVVARQIHGCSDQRDFPRPEDRTSVAVQTRRRSDYFALDPHSPELVKGDAVGR